MVIIRREVSGGIVRIINCKGHAGFHICEVYVYRLNSKCWDDSRNDMIKDSHSVQCTFNNFLQFIAPSGHPIVLIAHIKNNFRLKLHSLKACFYRFDKSAGIEGCQNIVY